MAVASGSGSQSPALSQRSARHTPSLKITKASHTTPPKSTGSATPILSSRDSLRPPAASRSSRASSRPSSSGYNLSDSETEDESHSSGVSRSYPDSRLTVQQQQQAPETGEPDHEQLSAIDTAVVRGKKKRPHLPHKFRSSPDNSDNEYDPEAMAKEVAKDAEACKLAANHIHLDINGQIVHSVIELPEPAPPEKTKYVWELIYENQRGMALWGKTYYSSNTLLPTDPTPFTLPNKAPETDITEARPAARSKSRRVKAKSKLIRKSIDTAYDLRTYQTPDPSWQWITPWMVNMRVDADEQGWRYNLWFHRTQWRSHPGHLNWWGWVRRREWMRLRALAPVPANNDEDDGSPNQQTGSESLQKILKDDNPMERLVRTVAAPPLDREKLDLWNLLLDNADIHSTATLSDLLKESGKLELLSRAFVYESSRDQFFDSLITRDIVEQQDCTRCLDIHAPDVLE